SRLNPSRKDHMRPRPGAGLPRAAASARRRRPAAAKPRRTLPCSRSNAASRGSAARTLSSFGSPAKTPVTKASASVSATSSPARRQPAGSAVEEKEAVAAGGLAGGDEALAQADLAAEVDRGGVVVEEAVRPSLDREAVALQGADRAAEPRFAFENGHLGRGQPL